MNELDVTKCGVYIIRNKINGKVYVGSTINKIKRRWQDHLKRLKRGTHANTHLQSAYLKYGAEAFSWEVIENTSREETRKRESYWINYYDARNPKVGYNEAGVNSEGNPIVSEATKAKLSAITKQQWKDGIHSNACKKGVPSWNAGIKCPNISKTRREYFGSIAVYKEEQLIAIFRSATDIEEWTTNNELPGLTYYSAKQNRKNSGKFTTKLRASNIHRAIREQKIYRGLIFKKVLPLPPEMGVVQWVNCENGEIPNSQPSQPLTKLEGSETNS